MLPGYADRALRSVVSRLHACLRPRCQSHRVEVRASHAASSPTIINAGTLSRCCLMLKRTLRRSLGPLMTCYVISAALLHLTIVLFDHKRLPHNQLGSI